MDIQKRVRSLEAEITQLQQLSALSIPLSLATPKFCYFPAYNLPRIDRNLDMPPAKKPPGKKPEEKDDPEKKPPEKKPPEKKYVPGWNPVSDDEKDKGAKKSRRRKKGGNKDEPSEAGPSVQTAPSPYMIS